MNKAVILVSACLLGENVRFDAGNKIAVQVKQLTEEFDLLPLCPEAEAGLGIPRPPINLYQTSVAIEALGAQDQRLNVTGPLRDYAYRTIAQLAGQIHGAVLKARSPSCGLSDAPLYDLNNQLIGRSDGFFAQALKQHLPQLPVATEEQLNAPENLLILKQQVRDYFANTRL